MQLRALLYFHELVRQGSMRRVAEKFGVAPTAVSRQIDNLEYHFGAPLLERDPTGVRLTAAGELLAARSARTLRDLDHVRTLIGDLKGLRAGRVAVHANGAAASGLLVPALAAFTTRFPRVRIDLEIASVGRAIAAVREGEADLALTLFTPPEAEALVRYRFRIAHAAILSPRHPLAGQAEVALEDLLAHPLALPDVSFGVRQMLDRQVRQEGLAPLDPVFTTSSLETQKELARQGAAILVLPALAVLREIGAGELKALPLAGGRLQTSLDVSHSRDRPLSYAAEKLLAVLEEQMRGVGPDFRV